MKTMEIVSQETVCQNLFLAQSFGTKKLEDFMLYFAQILKFAQNLGMIAEDICTRISNLLIMGIQETLVFDDDDDDSQEQLMVTNSLYVLNLYLSKMSSWEAWLKLKEVTNLSSATDLSREAKQWLFREFVPLRNQLQNHENMLRILNLKQVTEYYRSLYTTLNQCMAYDSSRVRLDLRRFHSLYLSFGLYTFVHNVDNLSDDLVTRLKCQVKSICMEISILMVVKTHQIVQSRREEMLDANMKQEATMAKIDEDYKTRLRLLKEEYADRMRRYQETIHRPGRKSSDIIDVAEIERDYLARQDDIREKWDEAIKKAEKSFHSAWSLPDICSKILSLLDIIKEYALYSMAVKGEVSYPETLEKRTKVLEQIASKKAIKEFVENNSVLLSEEQIAYLLNEKEG